MVAIENPVTYAGLSSSIAYSYQSQSLSKHGYVRENTAGANSKTVAGPARNAGLCLAASSM